MGCRSSDGFSGHHNELYFSQCPQPLLAKPSSWPGWLTCLCDPELETTDAAYAVNSKRASGWRSVIFNGCFSAPDSLRRSLSAFLPPALISRTPSRTHATRRVWPRIWRAPYRSACYPLKCLYYRENRTPVTHKRQVQLPLCCPEVLESSSSR